MGAQFTDFGNFGAISPELILRSLIGCVVDTGQGAFRIESHLDVTESPVHCANFEDFQINLQRCLTMADDGFVALRVNWVQDRVSTCGLCANAITWFDYLNALFGEDAEGLVYFNIYVTNALQ